VHKNETEFISDSSKKSVHFSVQANATGRRFVFALGRKCLDWSTSGCRAAEQQITTRRKRKQGGIKGPFTSTTTNSETCSGGARVSNFLPPGAKVRGAAPPTGNTHPQY